MNSSTSKVIKSVSIIAVLTLCTRFLGLLRDVIIASKFGADSKLDTYFAASNLPMILFMTIGTAIATTLIPLYNDKLNEGRDEAYKFINNVLNFFVVATLIIAIIGIIFSKQVVGILNPGFTGDQVFTTRILTMILLPTLTFNAIIYIFNGVLQSEGKFSVTAVNSLPLNIIIIGYLFIFGRKYGIVGLTIVTFIGTFAQIIPQIPYMHKVGFRYKPFLDFKDKNLRKMGIMILPVILGTGVQQINSFVERGFATNFGSGSLSAMSYAYRVFTLIVDMFVVAISTVIYPMMAKQAASNRIDEIKVTLKEYLNFLIVILIPLSLIVILQSKSIVYILFERGAFTKNSTFVTGKLLAFYSIGLLAYGLRDFLCKTFYTLQDTRTPMINSAIGMLVNIVLIFIFQRFIGLYGLGLANATSTYIASFLLIISLRVKLGQLKFENIFKTGIKTLIASSAMGLVLISLNGLIMTNYVSKILILIKLCIVSLCAILVFIIIGALLNIEEIRKMINFILNKIRVKLS